MFADHKRTVNIIVSNLEAVYLIMIMFPEAHFDISCENTNSNKDESKLFSSILEMGDYPGKIRFNSVVFYDVLSFHIPESLHLNYLITSLSLIATPQNYSESSLAYLSDI